eukprot:NODE_1377_length_1161_cov_301.247740.p2 GENE.NODE_1377_length_1161_cov_301.247740~~NODE_1377_length_1161_cov_301.247740.p2  ORF type:complete len:239 (-),score=42.53 NODE_1377_length_1161_cov_301.247740:85-801(-)
MVRGHGAGPSLLVGRFATATTSSKRFKPPSAAMATKVSNGDEMVVKVRLKTGMDQAWCEAMVQVSALRGRSEHLFHFTEILEDASMFYAVMHENNLVHRDVKPENIVFTHDGIVKVIDVDTVTEYSPESSRRRHFVGTPDYIAPEVLLGEIVPQSGLGAVGVILHSFITDQMPWTHVPPLDCTVGSASALSMYQAMRNAQAALDWDLDPWPQFPGARNLCRRPTHAGAASHHAWLRTR